MKLSPPPEALVNLKDWLYSLSVVVGVPSVVWTFLASHIEAKKFTLQYIQENLQLIMYIGTFSAVIILLVIGIIMAISKITNKLLMK